LSYYICNLKTLINAYLGRAIAQAVSRWLPTAAARVQPGPGQVGFVVDEVSLGQVFSEYFGFPCQSSFPRLLHHHNHPGQVQQAIQMMMMMMMVVVNTLHAPYEGLNTF
jgi:hypothetical protein